MNTHTNIKKDYTVSSYENDLSSIYMESDEITEEQLDEIYAKMLEMIAKFKASKPIR